MSQDQSQTQIVTPSPDTITIESVRDAKLTADSASMRISITGSALFSGSSAFKKAKEVAELIDSLKEIGIEQETMTIEDVRVDASTFAGIKSSSCLYTIAIDSVPAELLPKALATIATAKQADLRQVTWGFSNLEAELEQLREEAIKTAMEKAKTTAGLLGVSIQGVHEFTESVSRPDNATRKFSDPSQDLTSFRKARSKAGPQELGIDLLHTGTLTCGVKVNFRVSALKKD